VIVIAIGSVHT